MVIGKSLRINPAALDEAVAATDWYAQRSAQPWAIMSI
jgi:hypothetical protein